MCMYTIGKLHILFSESFITKVQTSLPCRHLFSSFLCIPYPQYTFNKILSFASEKTSLKCILFFCFIQTNSERTGSAISVQGMFIKEPIDDSFRFVDNFFFIHFYVFTYTYSLLHLFSTLLFYNTIVIVAVLYKPDQKAFFEYDRI